MLLFCFGCFFGCFFVERDLFLASCAFQIVKCYYLQWFALPSLKKGLHMASFGILPSSDGKLKIPDNACESV